MQMPINASVELKSYIQAHLPDTVYLLPDHLNRANNTMNTITQLRDTIFLFPRTYKSCAYTIVELIKCSINYV